MDQRIKKELPIPDNIIEQKNAIELLRVWAGGGKQYVSISTGIWDDPAAWGIMLVDLANHIANSYEGNDKSSVLERIKQGFDIEWEHSTSIAEKITNI